MRRFVRSHIARCRLALLMILVSAGVAFAAGTDDGEQQTPGESPVVPGPGPHAESRVYGIGYIEEDDTDGTELRGVHLLWSNWDESVDWNGGFGLWLSGQWADGQTVIGSGVEVTLLPWVPNSPWRIGPRFRLGAEYRRRDPDDGFGGLFAAGIEGAVWMGRGLQLALTVDREFHFTTDDRTEYGLSLRFARSRY